MCSLNFDGETLSLSLTLTSHFNSPHGCRGKLHSHSGDGVLAEKIFKWCDVVNGAHPSTKIHPITQSILALSFSQLLLFTT